MPTTWTPEQREAIETRDAHLLISASAGAGKTAVLVQRVIERLTDPRCPADIDRLLVVTFTQAAAAEMRERIGLALAQALAREPHAAHLRRQLLLLEQASITTLHSFCLDLMRRYFYLLQLPPSFRVMGETESSLLRQEILEEVLEDRYARALEAASPFGRLVDSFGGQRDDRLLQDLILRLYTFSRTHPWPRWWLERLPEAYRNDAAASPDDLPWVRALREGLAREIKDLVAKAREALALAQSPGGPAPYADALRADLAQMEDLYQAARRSWDDLCRAARNMEFPALRRCPAGVDPELKDRVQALRQDYKDRLRSWQQTYFTHTSAAVLSALRDLAPLVEELVQAVLDFGRAYQEAKEQQGLVDFSDLEHYCLRLLLDPEATPGDPRPSDLARELREHFVEVLVDEYQDINALQELILHLVSRPEGEGPNLVLIGDVKQSIYRFRWAEPGLFLEKYLTYGRSPGSRRRRVDLTVNFRSRPEILHAVNFIFRQIMTPEVGELDYDEAAELRPGASYPAGEGGGQVEVHLLELAGRDEPAPPAGPEGEEPDEEEPEAVQAEARLVARRIRELLEDTRVWDPATGSCRPLAYRDIAVLLRSTRGRAGIFLEELARAGIPAYADTGEGYFASPEVATVVSLLQVIDNPYQDIPLAAVLRSPLVGLKAADLARIRAAHPGEEFAAAVLAEARSGRGPLAARLAAFWQKLESWRTLARRGKPSDLIWTIFRETGYYDWAGGLPGGRYRQANLRALIDRARQYEQTSLRGLFGFLRFIDRLMERGEDLAEAQPLGEKEDVVRVISVHKSKGLEFPVVIVAGLGTRFNFQDLYRNSLIHRELGLGLEWVDPERRLAYPTLLHLAVRDRLKKETLAEEMRILYVALTRAREKLILVGSFRGGEKGLPGLNPAAAAASAKLPASSLARARSFLDWLLPALARHPDGEEIRRRAGSSQAPPRLLQDPSSWEIRFFTLRDLAGAAEPGAEEELGALAALRALEPVPAGPRREEIVSVLEWEYPYHAWASVPAKVSVSDLTTREDHLFLQDDVAVRPYLPRVARQPRFATQAAGLSAAEVGSAYHLVMQHLNLKADLDAAGIARQIQDLVDREILTAEQAAAVSCADIAALFATDLGRRLLAARTVRREVPFTLSLPACRLYPELEGEGAGESVVVQGIIDCLADEGDGWLLIDYKTDRVDPGNLQEVVRHYTPQLNIYGLAVETIYGRPVKEKYLYFFTPGIPVSCP
ncbi:helicase-exonuclease AddAB subunit AddA [Thermanaeromonas sp. C210]|uniref:helicase-exonuclease AddAB subunit AddA n=1 Tax=Thermanaeromonas sp. C210 TaxID=2731925 RepID=UPI00155B5F8E|nr:helicase-exonuclease AddAB subunit AddA [Thermanaeromonas sp. C210]GFN23649.1 ATP-dependent helicase/nuclease subunit A [Thermanaeromonas sp. C210]